jgi:hypothetical protein
VAPDFCVASTHIHSQVIGRVVDELEHNVLSKMPFINLEGIFLGCVLLHSMVLIVLQDSRSIWSVPMERTGAHTNASLTCSDLLLYRMTLQGSKVDGLKEATQQAVLAKQNHCSAEFRCTYFFPKHPGM